MALFTADRASTEVVSILSPPHCSGVSIWTETGIPKARENRVYKPPLLSMRGSAWLSCQPLCALLISAKSPAVALPPILIPSCRLSICSLLAMILSPSQSTGFTPQFVRTPRQEIPSSFSMSSIPPSTSTSVSTPFASATASTPASTSGYEVDVEIGITPSATMFSTSSVPVQVPVQYPSIPFVPAHARMAEFERLREDLRRTEMVRDQQVEMLQALADAVSDELDLPQVRLFQLTPMRLVFSMSDLGVV